MKRQQPKIPSSNILVLSFLTCMVLSGCAALTESQIREVEKFATLSRIYSDLPSTLAQSYGELTRNSKLLIVARKEFGQLGEKGGVDTAEANDAWETICDAYRDQTEYEAAGKRMDAALSMIRIYSDLLTALVSEKFTKKLSDSAEELGKSLHDATEEYNRKYRTDDPVKALRGTTAMTVRFTGGLYIRIKQSKILKATLKEADPLIADLMDEINTITAEKFKPSLLNYENNYLQNDFKSLANNKKSIEVTTVSFVYDSLYKTRQTIILADRIEGAAKAYTAAHDSLVENTRTRKTLNSVIEKIKALAAEIDAANKVKKEVTK